MAITTKEAYNILIEVKYRDGAPIKNDDAISELCSSANTAIIVSKLADDFGMRPSSSGGEMLCIPSFAFLYLLGYAEKNGHKGIY